MKTLFVPAMLTLLLVAAGMVHAAEPIILAGEVAFRVADPGPFGSAAARASAIDKRICDALSYENVGQPQMKVAMHNGRWSVYIGNTLLASVYPQDLQHYPGLSAKQVAGLWAQRLKRLFPLAEPLTKRAARRAGKLATGRPTIGHLRPQRRRLVIPTVHWGLVNKLLILLWQARQAPKEGLSAKKMKIAAEIYELASRHYYAPPVKARGHEPGKCPSLKDCKACQADMQAATTVPQAKHSQAAALARALAADPTAQRAVLQALDYVRRIDKPRFFAERVRIAWTVWTRLAARAKALVQSTRARAGG